MVKNLSANVEDLRDVGSIPRSGCIPGVGNGNPLQYSCLENSMDRGSSGVPPMWLQKVRYERVTECTHTHTHTHIYFKRSGYNGRLLFDGQLVTDLENRRNRAEHPSGLCLPLCYTHLQVHTVILLFLLAHVIRNPLLVSWTCSCRTWLCLKPHLIKHTNRTIYTFDNSHKSLSF